MLKSDNNQWHAIDYKEVLENFESSLQGLEIEEVNKNYFEKYKLKLLIK